jgi:hypothetical protein
MDWARIMAFVTGMVDQELLARNEYLAADIRLRTMGPACRRPDQGVGEREARRRGGIAWARFYRTAPIAIFPGEIPSRPSSRRRPCAGRKLGLPPPRPSPENSPTAFLFGPPFGLARFCPGFLGKSCLHPHSQSGIE